MLGIQDYRWKKITIDNNKNSKISDSWKDWKPRTNENRDCCWKTVALEAKLKIFWQIRSFASKSVVFRQNWVFLIPFDLLLMRLPSLLSPSTHCQSWFWFCVIWSYGGHMKQVAQLVPFIEISPREQRFSILSCWRPANNLIESIVCCVVLL